MVWQCSDEQYQSQVHIDQIDYNWHIRPILSDKCFACHGPDHNARQASLRLDTEEGAFAALNSDSSLFAIVPHQLAESELYQRIIADDPLTVMPPPDANLALTEGEKKLIKKWIEQGAPYKKHWAFLPPQKMTLPEVNTPDWPINEIDYFVLAKMHEQDLAPNSQADRDRLLKRLAVDLTGLPPSLALQQQFAKDQSADAYEKVIDQLLASPHYGEKMAIHWLDVARYADSHGYQDDGLRTMWPWRDWVIHAFNENYPYDQFITWQLAGDLLPKPNKEQLLATGFNRNHKITQEGGVIDEEYRVEYVTDRTNTFGKALLGLTFECAKCHDHKYDPISQEEYFSTFAFFNQVPEKGIVGTIDASFADPPNMEITNQDVQNILDFVNKKDSTKLEVMIMQDSMGMRQNYVLERGNYDAHGKVVHTGLPKAILPFDTNAYVNSRLGLAQWLFEKNNPLTARVFVNRIWQEIFGRGLVKTSGDFGMQGSLPSHPQLLDWLAVDFQENGWDIKRLVKQIVLSATYRQSSNIAPHQLERDPENVYLSRGGRIRFPAEVVRDHVLASSGLLNPELGGPSVKPYQPDGIWEAATSGRGTLKNYVQDHGDDLYRRGMYVFIKRTVPPPSMLMFDASNRDQCEVRRLQTNTPLQALVMLNDPHVLEASRVLAESLCEEITTPPDRIEVAFQRIICRPPSAEEKELLVDFYQEEHLALSNGENDLKTMISVGEKPLQHSNQPDEVVALMRVIHTMYNMEEAITKT